MLEAFKSLHYFIFFSDTEHFLSYKLCFRHGLTKPSRPRSSKIRQVQEYDDSCSSITSYPLPWSNESIPESRTQSTCRVQTKTTVIDEDNQSSEHQPPRRDASLCQPESVTPPATRLRPLKELELQRVGADTWGINRLWVENFIRVVQVFGIIWCHAQFNRATRLK